MAWDTAYWEFGYDEGYAARKLGEPKPDYQPANPRRGLTPEQRGFLSGWRDADEVNK